MNSSNGFKFYLTDVFGLKKYNGNQLATFVDCENLATEEMQQIAREINFSETTFVSKGGSDASGFDVRIFTPGSEVPFAGHPVLGTAWVLREIARKNREAQGLSAITHSMVLNLSIGKVVVSFADDGLIWMQQPVATFGDSFSAESLAPLLGLESADIDDQLPIMSVSTGFPHLIVPLKNMDALRNIRVDRKAALSFVSNTWAKNILVFAPNVARTGQSLGVRVFADYYGVAEDAATGSGNGALAAYLSHTGYLGGHSVDTVVGQGYEMGRPSQLHLRAKKCEDEVRVEIGGQVFFVAEGMWAC